MRLVIKNKAPQNKFRKLLLHLSSNTLYLFNPFGRITDTNIHSIVKKELERKDKLKFFSFLGKELISYSFLTTFEKPTKKHNCILGMVVGDKWQKQGYGKRICKHMIKTAWKKGFKKIWLTVFADNLTAQKLYLSLGFEIEGIFLADEIENGKKRDVVSMAIIKNYKKSESNRIRLWKKLSKKHTN